VGPVGPTSNPSSVRSPIKLNAFVASVISVGDIEYINPFIGPVLPFGVPFVEPTNMYKNPPLHNTKSPITILLSLEPVVWDNVVPLPPRNSLTLSKSPLTLNGRPTGP
jgi:hypothetical protein